MKSRRILWIIAVLLMAAVLLWFIGDRAQISGLLQREMSVRSAGDALGLVSYLSLWAGCCLGLLACGSLVSKRAVRIIGGAHASLLIFALFVGMLHPLLLLCYPGSALRLYQIFVPFTAPYHPVLYGLGTIAFYGMFLIACSGIWSLPRRRSLWRAFHLCAYAVYLFALVHAMIGGPHSEDPVYFGLYAATCILLLVLVIGQLRVAVKQKNVG